MIGEFVSKGISLVELENAQNSLQEVQNKISKEIRKAETLKSFIEYNNVYFEDIKEILELV